MVARMKKKKLNYPSKTTLNLVMKEIAPDYVPKLFAAVVIFCVALTAFTKFAVLDRFEADREMQSQLRAAQTELRNLRAQNAEYEMLRAEYAKYFAIDLTSVVVADVTDILDIMETELMPAAIVNSATFSGTTLSVVLSGIDLDGASGILASLYETNVVSSVQLYAANTTEAVETAVTMTITLKTREEIRAEALAEAQGGQPNA